MSTDIARLKKNSEGKMWLVIKPKGHPHSISLPVILIGSRERSRSWTWNGSLAKPTVVPSIKTWLPNDTISHIWLTDGKCSHLEDSTDGLAGQVSDLEFLE